jgi:hypothetical protein
MQKSIQEKWLALYRQRQNLEGLKVVAAMNRLYTAQYILETNYQELLGLVEAYEHDLTIWTIENRHVLEKFLLEFSRFLHNYLASRHSFVSDTKVLLRSVRNSTLKQECQKQLAAFQASACTLFVNDLQFYIQNVEISEVTATFFAAPVDAKKTEFISQQKLLLKKEKLLEWKRWKQKSRNYIREQKQGLDLKHAIINYQQLIQSFYDWFYRRIHQLYSTQIAELRAIEAEMLRLQQIED